MLLPLDGILVADFSRILAGPLCTMLLGDAGARVIKIEEPNGDETRRWGPPFAEGESAYFLSINRNKESIAIDLKTDEGRRIAHELIARADVVVENFLLPQKEKLGLTIGEVRRTNPRAVVLSISGFPADSADAGRPGYDLLAQAAGGLMAITGEPDGMPMKSGVAIADVLTAHHAQSAILIALLERERLGTARHIELSLLAATAASLINVGQSALVTGRESKRYGNEHPSIVPYQPFATADGFVVIAVASDPHWKKFCVEVLQDGQLGHEADFATNPLRVTNRRALIDRVAAILSSLASDEILRRCDRASIPAAPIRAPREVLQESTYVETVEHSTIGALDLIRNPIRDETRRTRLPPPLLGEHTAAILAELGRTEEEIERLRRERVVV